MQLKKIRVNTGVMIKWKHGDDTYVSYVDKYNHDRDYTYCLTKKQMVCPPIISEEVEAC
jgi:hypothetical protein